MSDFQNEPLELPTNLERLDQTLHVVGIKGWAIISVLLLLIVLTLGWAVFGTIPITISGKCIALDPQASYLVQSTQNGVVKSIPVSLGNKVQQGTPLLLFESGDTINAPVDGKVISIDVAQGEVIASGHSAFWMEKQVDPENLKILVFVPLFLEQQIKPGMVALAELDIADSEKYGRIQGKVEEIVPYPIDESDLFLQKIPSISLRKYLLEGPVPSVMVIVNPDKDPASPSGLKWTSKVSPPNKVQPGTIGEAIITLENVEPIRYLIPSIGRKVK